MTNEIKKCCPKCHNTLGNSLILQTELTKLEWLCFVCGYSNLQQQIEMLENKVELLEEDLECVHIWLDTFDIARTKYNREANTLDKYSMIGRMQILRKQDAHR